MRDTHDPVLFEVAWEVANKGNTGYAAVEGAWLIKRAVGGIYTVLKTKAPSTVEEYGDKYFLVGPLSYKSAGLEVESLSLDSVHGSVGEALQDMSSKGVRFIYGRWLIEGSPKVILFDVGSMYSKLDEWKGDLWKESGVPSPPNDFEMNDSVVFGYIVAWFLGEVG